MIGIGIDPHKSSTTAAVIDPSGCQLAVRRFVVNAGTARQLLAWAAQWHERRFAIEGANGLGRGTAQILVAHGKLVVDVPSTLATKVRLLSTGGGRKSDPAHHGRLSKPRSGPRRDYYLKKTAEGKTHREAPECTQRRLSNVLYRRILHDHQHAQQAAA